VRFCAVIGIPDPLWQQRVTALIELEPFANVPNLKAPNLKAPNLKDIQDHCRHYIAGYKIPRELVITEFKRTANGKIDYVWAKAIVLESLSQRQIQKEPCL
jgi:acyl-CoA synthetase (AMP-forming)/AMP-acid ligase II